MNSNNHPLAFLSYVQRVDKHDGGRISQFRDLLSEEVSLTLGEDFHIFQDRQDIQWGENWRKRIEESLDSSTFLIPIITPDYFNSEACQQELLRFLEREKELNRSDLILPVYYITTDKLEKPEKQATAPLAQAVVAHQWVDWRELRFESFDSPVVRKALAQLATQIKDALERVETSALPRLSLLGDVVSQLIEVAKSVGEDRSIAEEKIAKLAFLYAGNRYGIAYESIVVDCHIYPDGSATVTRQVDLTAYANTEQLDTFLLMPEEPPAGQWDINPALVEVQSTTKGKQVTLSQTTPKADRLTSILNIEPPLTNGEKIGYSLKEPLPPQFYTMRLTESRLEEDEDNYDYFGWNINRPSEKFSLRVHFPADFGLPQDFQVQVRYASGSGLPASHFQHQEQLRSTMPVLRRGDNNEGYMLQLNVDYPMTGLIYILKWLPRVDDALFASLMNKPISGGQRVSGIAPKLYHRLRQELINCGPFSTHQELRAIFLDSRIFAWRDLLVRTETPISRVEAVIDLLYNQTTSNQENALVLLLYVLSERLHPEIDCRQRLEKLAKDLSKVLGNK